MESGKQPGCRVGLYRTTPDMVYGPLFVVLDDRERPDLKDGLSCVLGAEKPLTFCAASDITRKHLASLGVRDTAIEDIDQTPFYARL